MYMVHPLIRDPSLHFNLRYAIRVRLHRTYALSSHSTLLRFLLPVPYSTPDPVCAAFSRPSFIAICPGIPLRLTRNIELKGIPHEGRRQLDNGQCGKLPARANMTAC